MFTVILSGANDRQQSGAWHPIPFCQHLHLDHFGSSICNGAGFIKHHRLNLKVQTDFFFNGLFRDYFSYTATSKTSSPEHLWPCVPSLTALLPWWGSHSGLPLLFPPLPLWGWRDPASRGRRCTGQWWRPGRRSGWWPRPQRCSYHNPAERDIQHFNVLKEKV